MFLSKIIIRNVSCVSYSPDNNLIATGSYDGMIYIWWVGCNNWNDDDDFGKEILQLKGHTDIVYCLQFLENSSILISVGRDNSIILWNLDMDNKEKLGTIINSILCSDQNNEIIITNV